MAEGGDSVDGGRKFRGSLRDNIPDISSLCVGSESVEPMLCREHSQEFKYFCKVHMTEMCIACKRMGHRNCKAVEDLGKAAEDIYSNNHGKMIIQSVKDLSERFKACKNAVEDIKNKMPFKRKLALENVKHARKLIDEYLDKLEADSVAEIDRLFTEETKVIEEQNHICDASLSSLQTRLSHIDRAWSVGNKDDKFIEINRATKQTKQYCDMLLDLRRELSEFDAKFKPNCILSDVFHSLGTVTVDRLRITDVSTNTDPIYMGEMKIKQNDGEEQRLVVTSFDILPDKRRIVHAFDTKNSMIQLYDSNNIFVTETPLPDIGDEDCFKLVLCGSTESLVLTDSDRVFKVTIGEVLAIKEIKTKLTSEVLTMTKYGEDFISVLYDGEQFDLCIIDKNMATIVKTILKDDGTIFKSPIFIGISTDKNSIYVVDMKKGCYGMSLEGLILFHYQNHEAKRYYGLEIDNDGLFIAPEIAGEYHIEKINARGERDRVSTTFDSYPVIMVENELVLCNEDENSNTLFQFYCV